VSASAHEKIRAIRKPVVFASVVGEDDVDPPR
jgi:hypothetical protein